MMPIWRFRLKRTQFHIPRSFLLLAPLLLAPLATLLSADALQKALPLPGQVFWVEGHTAFVILPPTRATINSAK